VLALCAELPQGPLGRWKHTYCMPFFMIFQQGDHNERGGIQM